LVWSKQVRFICLKLEASPSSCGGAVPVFTRIELKSLTSEYGFLRVLRHQQLRAFPIADATIHCDVHGSSGTVIHTFDFVVYELVPANDKKPINNYKFGFWPQESSQMDCRSISVERR
jgi:hypothetical protein